jgi:hypothetical protein
MPLDGKEVPWIPSAAASQLRVLLVRARGLAESLFATTGGVATETSLRELAGILDECVAVANLEQGFRWAHTAVTPAFPNSPEDRLGAPRIVARLGPGRPQVLLSVPKGEKIPIRKDLGVQGAAAPKGLKSIYDQRAKKPGKQVLWR